MLAVRAGLLGVNVVSSRFFAQLWTSRAAISSDDLLHTNGLQGSCENSRKGAIRSNAKS